MTSCIQIQRIGTLAALRVGRSGKSPKIGWLKSKGPKVGYVELPIKEKDKGISEWGGSPRAKVKAEQNIRLRIKTKACQDGYTVSSSSMDEV